MAKLRVKRAADARGRRPVKGFYGELYDKDRTPRQLRVSLQTKDEQAARLALAKLERAYADSEFDPWAGDRRVVAVAGRSATVAAAVDEYVASRKADLAASSLATDRYVLGRFEKSTPTGAWPRSRCATRSRSWPAGRRGRDAGPFVFPGRGGEKLAGDYLGKRFAEYRERAGLRDGLTFHGLRHTFGSYAVMRGLDVYRLKEVMGHADVKTTMVYAKLRPV